MAEMKKLVVGNNEYEVADEKARDALFNTAENIYKGAIKEGGYYQDDVWVESAGHKCAILPLDSVKNGDILTYSPEFSYYKGQFRFDAFSADGTWIKKLYNGYDNTFTVEGVDAESFYIVMRILTRHDESELKIVIGNTLEPEDNIQLLFEKTKEIEDKLAEGVFYGKMFNCLGDSFTAPETAWHSFIAERTGAICNNYGVASSRVTIDVNDIESFLNRYADMDTTADVTIIFGGINDSRSMYNDGVNPTIELGDMSSPLNNSTFYGGLRLLIESIKSFMPSKKIIGIIPPDFEQTEPYLVNLPLVQEACRKVYEHYGIPYADLKKNCQEMYIDEYNLNTYRKGNNYHPSTAGHEAISEIIQGLLQNVLKA